MFLLDWGQIDKPYSFPLPVNDSESTTSTKNREEAAKASNDIIIL
jgi:hypothetical protein